MIAAVYCLAKCYYYFCVYLVPTPDVNVTALSNQTVSQDLTLQCKVTTVRGITSRVDIVWNDGTVLMRTNDTNVTTVDNSLVYTDSYYIDMLNTSDHNRTITCVVVIDIDPTVTFSGDIVLDVIGKYCAYIMYVVQLSLIFYT